MSVTFFLLLIVIVMVCLILIISLVSPDAWGGCSANSGQTCCVSSGTSSGNASRGSSSPGTAGNKDYALATTKGTKSVALLDEHGEPQNANLIKNQARLQQERVKQTPDLFSLYDSTLSAKVRNTQRIAEKTNHFVPQRTYLISTGTRKTP